MSTAAWQEAPRAIEYHFQGPGLDIVVDRPDPFNGPDGFGYKGWAIAINGEVHWCSSVVRYRDGGTTIMETSIGTLRSPTSFKKDAVPTWKPSSFTDADAIPLERVRVPVPEDKFKAQVERAIEAALSNKDGWDVSCNNTDDDGWRVESIDGHVLFVSVEAR